MEQMQAVLWVRRRKGRWRRYRGAEVHFAVLRGRGGCAPKPLPAKKHSRLPLSAIDDVHPPVCLNALAACVCGGVTWLAGNSSFEIPWEEVGGLVEAGTIKADTLVFSDQSPYPFDEWVPWSKASSCFGSGDE